MGTPGKKRSDKSRTSYYRPFPEPLEQIEATLGRTGGWEGEIVHRKRDGSAVVVASVWVLQRDTAGRPSRVLVSSTDVTARKNAEAALRESEERFLDLANGIQQLAWMAAPDGSIFWYNRRWYEYTGTTHEQVQGWGWQSVHDPNVLPRVMEGWKAAIAASQPFDMEFPLRGADGRFHMFLTRVMPVRDREGRVLRWFGTNTDISDRKEAEDRLALQAGELARQAAELAASRGALEQKTRMLQLVLDSMGEGLIASDSDGRFLLWNDSAFKMMGRTATNLPIEEWTPHYKVYLPDGITPYPPDQLPLVRALHGESVTVELMIEHPERESGVFLEVTARPMKDSDGTLRGGVAALRDITERKRADAELARQAKELARQTEELLTSQDALETQRLMLRSVLDSMAEGLVATDEQGKFILWNTAAEKIVGLGPANLTSEEWSAHYGLYLTDAVTPFPSEQNPLLRAIRGEISTAEMYLRNHGLAEGIWVEASASPLKDKDGALRGGVVAFRDITQRRVDEREIRKLNDELEERVAKRTVQLEAANRELEAFSYSVSHDLRAPLRHISGFSKILVEDFGPALPAEAQHHLQRIELGAQRMGQLVDELLNLTRIGRQTLSIQVTGLATIAKDIVSILEPEIEGRSVEWKIGELPFVECDPILVRQVFQNLISNALKYSRPRNPAVIEIGQGIKDGQSVIFIRDNGVGFSMKYADKLFGVFQRLHRAEDFEGTGVGLALVHRIIAKHGGRIWAEAELDKGATFYFTLGSVEQPAPKRADAAAVGGL